MKYEIVGMQQVPVGGRTHACVLVPRDPLLYRCWCPSPKGPIVLSLLLPLSCVGMDRLNFAPSGAYHASLNVSTRRPGVAFVACGLLSVVVAQCTRRCVNGRWFARDGRLPAGAANCPLVRARTAPLVCAGASPFHCSFQVRCRLGRCRRSCAAYLTRRNFFLIFDPFCRAPLDRGARQTPKHAPRSMHATPSGVASVARRVFARALGCGTLCGHGALFPYVP